MAYPSTRPPNSVDYGGYVLTAEIDYSDRDDPSKYRVTIAIRAIDGQSFDEYVHLVPGEWDTKEMAHERGP